MPNLSDPNLQPILEQRKQELIEEIAANYKQLGFPLTEADKLRINRQIKDLEFELADINKKINHSVISTNQTNNIVTPKNNLPECDSFSINKTQETNPSTDGNLKDSSLSLGEKQNKKITDTTLVNSIDNRQNVEDKDNIYLYIDITVRDINKKNAKKSSYAYKAWIVYKSLPPEVIDTNTSIFMEYIEKELLGRLFSLLENKVKIFLQEERKQTQISYPELTSVMKQTIVEVFLDNKILAKEVENWLITKNPIKNPINYVGIEHKVVIRSRRVFSNGCNPIYNYNTIAGWNNKWSKVKKLIKQINQNQIIIFKDEINNDTSCWNDFLQEKIKTLIAQGINIIALNYRETGTPEIYLTCYKCTNIQDFFNRLKPEEIIFCILINNPPEKESGEYLLQAVYAGIPVALWLRQSVHIDDHIKLMKILFDSNQPLLQDLPEVIFQKRQRCNMQDYFYKVIKHTSLLWDDVSRHPVIKVDEKPISYEFNSPV